MFGEFFRFELRYQLRSPLPWVVALVFALMAFAATTSDMITIGEGIGNAHDPNVLAETIRQRATIGVGAVL